jgi:TRAP-type C4-dicarboxylate transport system permease small subunit
MIRRLDLLTTAIETALASLAAVFMFAIMAIVVSDVFMRYVLNQPYSWSYDLISLYLMAALFYLSLSRAFGLNAHIGVDILQSRMSVRGRRLCQVPIGLAVSGLFAAIAWVCAGRTWDDWTQASVAAGAIPWPSWLSDILVPIGASLISLRALLHAVAHGAAIAGYPEAIPLPPVAGTKEKVGFE